MLGHMHYLGEGFLTWATLGAFVGYMMGYFRENLDEGKGVFGDIAVGILSAVAGGFVVRLFFGGRPGFFLSVAVAAVAAISLTAAWRSREEHHGRID